MRAHVLIRGTASEVLGIDSETVFKNTVRDSNTVTSETQSPREILASKTTVKCNNVNIYIIFSIIKHIKKSRGNRFQPVA